MIIGFVWKCWVNLPNEIAIWKRDNDQQNHWVQWGTLFSDTPNSPWSNGNWDGFWYYDGWFLDSGYMYIYIYVYVYIYICVYIYMWIFKMLLLSDLHGLSSLHLDVLRTSDTLTDAASAVANGPGWVVAVMAETETGVIRHGPQKTPKR